MRFYKAYRSSFVLLLMAFTVQFQTQAQAQDWKFFPAIDVTASQGAGIFHHVESSGRRNIAVSKNKVAIVWEDNRNNTPQIFIASKQLTANAFTNEIKISGAGEAYEPSIVALDNDSFAVAWEEDSHAYVRLITPNGLGATLRVNQHSSAQVNLAMHKQQLLLVYSSKNSKHPHIRFQQLALAGQTLRTLQDCAVDIKPAKDDQSYPTIISLNDAFIVAWEDRRLGHTIIMATQSFEKSPCQFNKPQRISAGRTGNKRSSIYGKGHGVARVALAKYGSNNVLAVWTDKRDFREGYDIYAAHYQANNKTLFGLNEKVQDSFGSLAQQWHPTVAGHDAGNVVVAWDDNRDGNANIMLSWLEDNQWSDDTEAASATGPGEQTHPSIRLDEQGNLHLVWLDRATSGGPTRLRYTFGKR